MTGDPHVIVDLAARRRAAKAAAEPAARARPGPAFTAAFYDAEPHETICSVIATRLGGVSQAEAARKYADLMIKAAQAFVRDAERLEPNGQGAPVAIIRLHERGVNVVSMGTAGADMGEADIQARLDEAGYILARMRKDP